MIADYCCLFLLDIFFGLRHVTIISVLLLCCSTLLGQSLKGLVVDGETLLPMPRVEVRNINSGQSALTNTSGYFNLPMRQGDKVTFFFTGYHTVEQFPEPGDSLHIELLRISVHLPVYIVRQQTQFEKDSTEMAERYKTEIDRRPTIPKVYFGTGVGVDGLISSLAEKFNKNYKDNKKFRAAYKNDVEQKFIDTRYRPELVTSLTGLKGDSLIMFMNYHPMDYLFARVATDLEIKAWIRSTYKDYIKNKKVE